MFQATYYEEKYKMFLLYFIIAQPILDLLTSLSITVLKIDATPGILIRFFVMFLSICYIFLAAKDYTNRKFLYYLIALFFIIGIGFTNNIFIKKPILFSEEIKFIIKTLYPIIMLISYTIIFKSLKKQINVEILLRNYIVYAALIINSIMILSIITSTDFNSYPDHKVGSSGWFYAGNELGSILGICLPMVILYSIQNTTSLKKIYYWIPTLLTCFSLLAIGTKVGFISILIIFCIALAGSILEYFMKRSSFLLLNASMIVIVLMGIFFITPYTPVYKNTNIHLNLVGVDIDISAPEQNIKEELDKKPLEDEQVQNLLFSGRQDYLIAQKKQFKESPLSRKLFGLGYGGNYIEVPKMIEMDFHDIFYSFGYIGSSFIAFPLIYIIILSLVAVSKRFTAFLCVQRILTITALALALGIAYSAGHVITAPSVSIFLSLLLAYWILEIQLEK